MSVEIIGYIGPIINVGNEIKFGIGVPIGANVEWTDCIATDTTEGKDNIVKKSKVRVLGEYKEQQYTNSMGIVIPIQKFIISKVEKIN